jgi:hypothetical protein
MPDTARMLERLMMLIAAEFGRSDSTSRTLHGAGAVQTKDFGGRECSCAIHPKFNCEVPMQTGVCSLTTILEHSL